MANVVASGGPLPGPMVTCVPAGAWTDPAVGNLVIRSTGANNEVSECTDGQLPYGIVRAVSIGLDVLTVEAFKSGCIARLLHDTVALGDAVSADATKGAGYVDTDGAGVGLVIALDVPSGYADVEF